MAWNPETYNQFKNERAAPFYELLSLVTIKENMKVIDLGCGTGEATAVIADKLPASVVLGIDDSEPMLENSSIFTSTRLTFNCIGIEEQLASTEKWDLVFSNAAIQWVDDHEQLFPKMISSINSGGQLAVQMPAQHHNITNIILDQVADEAPFKQHMQGFKRISPVLNIDRYAAILFENGAASMRVYEKIYPLVLPDIDALFNWVSGTALIPYVEKMDEVVREEFITNYKKRLAAYFTSEPVFYAFKRILMHAQF